MRTPSLSLLLAGLLLSPVAMALEDPPPASASEHAAPAESAPALSDEADKVADDPITCRTEVETGALGRRNRICMKQSEWQAHRKAARRYKENIDRSRSTQPGGESLGASYSTPGR